MDQFNIKHLKNNIYQEQDPEFPKIKYKKLAKQTFEKLEGDEKNIPHYFFYKEELIKLLENIGFNIINIRTIRWNLVVNCVK